MGLFCGKDMRRILIHFPIVIVTFALALLLTPYNPTTGIRGLASGIVTVRSVERWPGRGMPHLYGTWGGSDAAVIELRENYILDIERGTAYNYRIINEGRYRDGESTCLIEVYELKPGTNLRKFMYLARNGGDLHYFGYSSWEDYEYGKASASISLSRRLLE